MLQVHQLRKDYGPATVLAGVSFLINNAEHVGLIGPNGAGKSTILRCLVGQEQPDSGMIAFSPPSATVGYLPQAFATLEGRTISEALAAAQADFVAAEQALHQATEVLASSDMPTTVRMEAALAAYDAALTHFEALGGYEREHRATAVLEGLGLGGIDPVTPVAQLSGGQKTRLGLATLLLREADLLLLDEPTNHLDVTALEWLEGFVRDYPRAVLIVSHDRAFLDRTVTRVLYLDGETRAVRSYAGGYSDFAAACEAEIAQQYADWQDQQLYIRQVEADIRRVKGLAMNIQNGPKRHRDYHGRISAKVARIGKSRERKLERYLESGERIDKPRQQWGLRLDFGAPPAGGRAVVRVEEVAFAYPTDCQNGTPGNAAPTFLLKDITFEIDYGERVAIVGPNGSGKTTLLRLLDGRLQPLAGQVRLGAGVRVGTLTQEQETLDLDWTVLDTVRRERPMSETEARNFLHYFLFGGDSVFKPVGACSPGERARLQLAQLVLRGCNLLLLDEPLNHLDIEAREHFEAALEAFPGTIVVVSHDRAFLQSFAERVLEVNGGQVQGWVMGDG
jgi:ATP-binding cassette subfamily F protein 3